MFNFFRKHYKITIAILVVVCLISIFSVYQKNQYLKHPYIDQIEDVDLKNEITEDYYYEQLSNKCKNAYNDLVKAIENNDGGLFVFEEALTGEEYAQIVYTISSNDYFYAIIDVPMTDKHQNINYQSSNILNIKDASIKECIIFLYPAVGLDINGEMDKEGYVQNLDELEIPLKTMDESRISKVNEIQNIAYNILDEVASNCPKTGAKDAITYYLNWMDENLVLDEEMMASTRSLKTMSDVFERVYFENDISAVVNGKTMATGYSKILTYLCNKSGIEAHIVLGNWKGSNGYSLVCVNFNGINVYVDASGYKSNDLWNQRMISETLAVQKLSMIDYFK